MARLRFVLFISMSFYISIITAVETVDVDSASTSPGEHVTVTEEAQTSFHSAVKPEVTDSYISFASFGDSYLFINGHYKNRVRGWGNVAHVDQVLQVGDVVSIYAQGPSGSKSGLIATVYWGNHHVSTGKGQWKAIGMSRRVWRHLKHWRTDKGSSCQWPLPVTRPLRKLHARELRKFPAEAEVVWANGADKRNTVLFRYVVGGEKCKTHQPTITRKLTRIYVRSRAKSWIYINGQLAAYVPKRGRRMLYRYIQKGDIIGVLSKGRRRRGVLLAIQGPLGYVHTGGSGWKGRMGWGRRDWATKAYSSCGWRRAVTIGKIRDRYAPRGNMIWGSRRQRGVSRLRYIVGGEECSSITYESRGPVQLYVNGQRVRAHRKGRYLRSVKTVLKNGDIVGILSYISRNAKHGALRAVVGVNSKYYATGKTGWRVAPLPKNSAWTRKGFDACRWKSGTVVGGWKQLDSSPVAAKALWTDGVAAALRFVVGGDHCKTPPQPVVKKAEVTLTGDNEATVFLNGQVVLRTKSWRSVAKAVVDVKSGDVFGVHAKDGGLWFGIRVGLIVDGNELGTGVGDWRARSANGVGGEWKKVGFKGCGWAKVVNAADVDKLFESGAASFPGTSKYVWASASSTGEDIVGRFVLGHSC